MMEQNNYPDFRFNLREAAGAVGDYGTLFPIVVGVSMITEIQLAPVLFFFAIFYILSGIYYRLPVPVEPMKAIGAVAIAGGLSAGEIRAAGIIMGLLFLMVGYFRLMDKLARVISDSLVRGVQLALALSFFQVASGYIYEDLFVGLIAVGIILVFTFSPLLDISSLVVLVGGVAYGIYLQGSPETQLLALQLPALPELPSFGTGFIRGVLPQIPVTVGNSILATSLLSFELLNKRIDTDQLAGTVGVMCLVSSPLGGLPMCHGAGGLAAQYRFGARTGGSNIISGLILLPLAMFLATPQLLEIIPGGVLGALLFFTGIQLLKSVLKTDNWLITGITGLVGIVNIALAFVSMLVVDLVYRKLNRQN